MSVPEQFDAIMALPIGGAVIACALGFFALLYGLAKFVVDQAAERRAQRDDLAAIADRMPGRGHD